jgi:methylmalonyl-CoA mutase C-terminal domain/subunit
MPIKVLLTKIGIDAHDRGVKVITYALRDAGMEVIYTGPWQTVEDVTNTAIQEDVDIIGVSTLGGDHLLMPSLLRGLEKEGISIPVVLGGIIPADVEKELRNQGVAEIFHPGTSMEEVVRRIEALVNKPKNAA